MTATSAYKELIQAKKQQIIALGGTPTITKADFCGQLVELEQKVASLLVTVANPTGEFKAGRTTNYFPPPDEWSVIPFDVKLIDTAGEYDIGGNRLYPSQKSLWFITCLIAYAPLAPSKASIALFKNGSIVQVLFDAVVNSGYISAFSPLVTEEVMNQGDYLELRVYTNTPDLMIYGNSDLCFWRARKKQVLL